MLDPAVCFRAMASRDRRFEGRFVVAVRTTKVFCRPCCPAPTPKAKNVSFYQHAAAAEGAGFRPCRRCRPELAPTLRLWPDTSKTVSRAMRLIAEGGLDEEKSLKDLAARMGVGERHLRRLFQKHVGASPVAVAQSHRVHLARRLLDETTLSITEIALSAGFSSIRRFNEVFQRTFSLPPSQLRTRKQSTKSGDVLLRLPFQPPYDWNSIISFLSERRIPGVESIEAKVYRRSFDIDGKVGGFEVRYVSGENFVRLRLMTTFPVDLLCIVERVRRLFDLDCDPHYLGMHLKGNQRLARLIRKRPGLRVPGAWNPFESAVRACVSQKGSVHVPIHLIERLVSTCGRRVDLDLPGVAYVFPTPKQIAESNLHTLGFSNDRARRIHNLAQAVSRDATLLDGSRELEDTVAMLANIPGITHETAQYVAMRALGEPDAFPASDPDLRKALALNGRTPTAAEITRVAEEWRPFRAYAAMHLWRDLR